MESRAVATQLLSEVAPQEVDSIVQVAEAQVANRIVAIIPAYNEERFIGSVVLKARRYADVVVVVDDGSTDGTVAVAAAAGAEVIRHPENRGKGAALATGFARARELDPCAVVTLDGDGQHYPEELDLVVQPVLSGNADIVVGSRYLRPERDVPLHRMWGHRFLNLVTNRLSGVPVTDSQSGFRAFSPRALEALSLSSRGFAVESEMQFVASEHSLRVQEVPVTIRYLDPPKRSVIAQGLAVLNGAIRLFGQHRPLLFFGVPGALALFAGASWGVQVVALYQSTAVLPILATLACLLLVVLGALSFFAGIILHSVRGLLLAFLRTHN